MLDADLAGLYHVTTKALNQAVKRNRDRFHADFMFQLTADEAATMRSQFVTASGDGTSLRSQIVTAWKRNVRFRPDYSVCLWDPRTGALRHSLKMEKLGLRALSLPELPLERRAVFNRMFQSDVRRLEFSEDGRILTVDTADGHSRWDVKTGKK